MQVASVLMALTAVFFAGQVDTSESGFLWHTELEAARETAARDGKPLLVVFR